jgi:hypothetical protein
MINRDGINHWDTEEPYKKLAKQTYEEVLSAGEDDTDKDKEIEHVSIRDFPFWLYQTLAFGSEEVQPKPISLASVQRITAKLGIVIIRDRYEKQIKTINSLRKLAWQKTYLNQDHTSHQMLLKKSNRNSDYKLQDSIYDIQSKCSIRDWTSGAITEILMRPLGLSASTATLLALVAGVATSTTWATPEWRQLAAQELKNFEDYLRKEAERLQNEVLK